MEETRVTSSELLTLFVPHSEGESLKDTYYRTMRSAAGLAFNLGVIDEALNALWDVIESATGEQGLWAAPARPAEPVPCIRLTRPHGTR